MTDTLFDLDQLEEPRSERLDADSWLFRRLASPVAEDLWTDLKAIVERAPFRHMSTSRGFKMSVAMTNCGTWGWFTDRKGYRYTETDPETGKPWPELPASFRTLATEAAAEAGYSDFHPDACLINRYQPGAKMGLHQDKDETDFSQPIVSVSLGLSVTFLFGGRARTDKTQKIVLRHGDVVVWGGESRLNFHGVSALKDGHHPLTGDCRINLTFRKAH